MALNRAQSEAVEHGQGPLLVLAGAGSGKTRVITHRIARLIDRGTRPEAILAVSFTNKAAAEMKERLANLIGRDTADEVWLSTFHSFGVRFLGEEAEALGHRGRFVIFDQGDAVGLVRELLRRKRGGDRRLDPGAVQARISLWKNKFIPPSEAPESAVEYDEAAREIYGDYERALRSMRAYDFDDLVVAPVACLKKLPAVREKWRNRFRHVLIDEFQDTNRAQLELVRALANELNNVCVVGDDDQSIYGWRGADVGNILDFEEHFRGARVVKLEENYRSTQPILEVANAAIAQSRHKRHGKVLRATRAGGERVRMAALDDATAEAQFVAREIHDLQKEGRKLADVAVLYRSNLQARLIEEELRAAGIAYRMFGGTQFFDRKEVKDAAAYLRVIVNPRDELSLRRVLNYPPRGIGDATIERLSTHALAQNISLAQAIEHADAIDGIPPQAKAACADFDAQLKAVRARFRGGEKLAATAHSLFENAGLQRELLDAEGGKVGARKWENVMYLVRSIERYEATLTAEKPSLAAFLQRITMRLDKEVEESGNRVTLSTLHAAKGLEFPIVFLIGCVEGQLPHSRTTDPKITEAAPTDVEEERRLFYVGVTRAKDRLYLTRPKQRSMRGRVSPVTPSRFLDGLPEAYFEHYERPDRESLESSEVADVTAAILRQLEGMQ
jgi:DNA helicase-2/ATP-dependent DNA helicase PcrA